MFEIQKPWLKPLLFYFKHLSTLEVTPQQTQIKHRPMLPSTESASSSISVPVYHIIYTIHTY